MAKIPVTVTQDFRKFDPTSIDAPPLSITVRQDQVRAFCVIGLALLVVFCSALSVLLTSVLGPIG